MLRRFALALLAALVSTNALASQVSPPVTARFYVLQLDAGQDVLRELQSFAQKHKLHAGFVASCSGEVACAAYRASHQQGATVHQGHFQIVALGGTFERDASNLSAAFADSAGATFGGRLVEGTTVYAETEIVVGELSGITFDRANSAATGARQLVIKRP